MDPDSAWHRTHARKHKDSSMASVTPETGMWQLLFSYQDLEKEKYKTVPQLNVTTTERKKKTGGHLQLSLLYSGEQRTGQENNRGSSFPQSRHFLYISPTHTAHINSQKDTQTHTQYLQYLEYLVTG